ncbi:MAG TPA: OsmC family protein [Steroidobacteraceae bacterium]
MQPLPHVYRVAASGADDGNLEVTSEGVPTLAAAAPKEYDGPGDQWSPESLLVAAVASCFILTFRAVARASKLPWQSLECSVEGTLDRVDRVTQFTKFVTRAKLRIDAGANEELCRRALEKAEQGCLIANSLKAQRELEIEIVRHEEPAVADLMSA